MVRILHLSDTHVSAAGPDEDGVDAVGSLRRMLHDARHVADLDLVVVSGDVADDGSAAGCRTVRDLVGAFAADRGIPHVYCPGNHDDRAGFAEALGSGHLGPDGSDRGTQLDATGRFLAAVSEVGGLRVVTLNSLVPGRTPGRLARDQLDALRALLDTPSPAGTLIVVHHPPVWPPSHSALADVALQDPEELAATIAGSDVRLILAGHLHLQVSGALAGVPVWVTPGVVTRIDLTAAPGQVRGVLGASATVVDLDRGPRVAPVCHLLHARDPRAGEEVYLDDLGGGDPVRSDG